MTGTHFPRPKILIHLRPASTGGTFNSNTNLEISSSPFSSFHDAEVNTNLQGLNFIAVTPSRNNDIKEKLRHLVLIDILFIRRAFDVLIDVATFLFVGSDHLLNKSQKQKKIINIFYLIFQSQMPVDLLFIIQSSHINIYFKINQINFRFIY